MAHTNIYLCNIIVIRKLKINNFEPISTGVD